MIVIIIALKGWYVFANNIQLSYKHNYQKLSQQALNLMPH